MNKFSSKLKKPCFWPFWVHFPNFWRQRNFPGKSGSVTHNYSYGFLAPCPNLEKVNNTIQRKRPVRRKDGRKDGQNPLYRTIPVTAGGPTINLR